MITGAGSSSPTATVFQIDYIEVTVHYERNFTDDSGETIADAFLQFWSTVGNTLMYLKRNTLDFVIDKANLILKGTLTVEPQEVNSGSTGAQSPTLQGEPRPAVSGAMWTLPDRAFSSNNSYTTAVTTQRFTVWKGFGLKALIPAGATIVGIEAKVEAKVSTGTKTMIVDLIKNGFDIAGINKTTGAFGTTDSVETVGSESDLWGDTWTPEDFGEDFGVQVTNTANAVTYSIDHITVNVYYTTTGDNSITGNINPVATETEQWGSSTKRIRKIFAVEVDTTVRKAYLVDYFVSELHPRDWTTNGTLTEEGNVLNIDDGGAPRDSQARTPLHGKVGTLQWDDGVVFKMEVMASFEAVSLESTLERMFLGFSTSTADARTVGNTADVSRRVGFIHYDGTIYAVCADGTTINLVELQNDSVVKQKRHYRIDYTTSSVDFYIDNAFVATLTSNIPTDANNVNINLAFSDDAGTADMKISNVIYSEKSS